MSLQMPAVDAGRIWAGRRWVHVVALMAAIAIFLAPPAVASAETVTVNLAGGGGGEVISSSPEGIECSNGGGGAPGPVCSADLTDFGDFSVLLTPMPSADSYFAGWTVVSGFGGGCTTPPEADPVCKPFLFAPTEVIATFELSPDPPIVSTDSASAGFNEHLATLNGRLNPNGAVVSSCRFEYGLTASYGSATACEQDLGSVGAGTTDVSVSAPTEPLEPGATYHFRLTASNVGGSASGGDQTFTTASAESGACPNEGIRIEQGVKALQLPNCMALEMVSPPRKDQQYAQFPSVSADGARVVFNSIATLGDSPGRLNPFGDEYVATRGISGWLTASTSPPSPIATVNAGAQSFTPDFSGWLNVGSTREQGPRGISQAFRNGLDRAFVPISPLLASRSGEAVAAFEGASMDHSHVYLETVPIDSASGSAATGGDSYLPGDPLPAGGGEDKNTYVASLDPGAQPSLELLSRDRDGKIWGGNCGARLGGVAGPVYLRDGDRSQGSIAADGSRTYFSTRPDQAEGGDCSPASKMRIMVRTESPTGPVIQELFQSECDRIAPACSADVGDDVYQGASLDQSRVYFTTNRQLADSDRDGGAGSCSSEAAEPGCDLYLYDSTKPAGQRLVQVSAGDASDPSPGEGADVFSGITAISADGSHAYFVAQGVLTGENSEHRSPVAAADNLYVYKYPEGDLDFVGTLDPGDQGTGAEGLFGGSTTWSNNAYPVPSMATDVQGKQVGGDGHVLLFRAKAALTADDGDTSSDLFRYDSDSGGLVRVSKAGPGGADDGEFNIDIAHAPESSTDYAVRGRWVSEDGEDVVFSTTEPLLPGDLNGAIDSYMWRHGVLFRLLGSAKSGQASTFVSNPTLSPDGSTVAFGSSLQLLPSDGDTVQDVYVARAGGGFPAGPPAPTCDGEACQGAPATVASAIGAASTPPNGRGNLKERPRRKCAKGKVRKHGRCVKKKEKNSEKPHRQASRRNHGGSK
jgi:hypothetical protein